MPIIRKLIIVGNSQAVTIPNTWLSYAEQQKNKKIIAIAMEINGCITLNPIFENKTKKGGMSSFGKLHVQ
jgi:antitoxin component of MazEF toxin-antitoxin module